MPGSRNESPTPNASGSPPADPTSLFARVQKVLDLIRPAIKSDGGDVELVSVTPQGAVNVRFMGACIGCPSSSITLQSGIERALKQRIPDVTSVHAVN
ncbi:MAG TPA: NifU family protein [Phycisphaerales bacterium]|nr:NifU family protein [Phycisphaerales bacterium]